MYYIQCRHQISGYFQSDQILVLNLVIIIIQQLEHIPDVGGNFFLVE